VTRQPLRASSNFLRDKLGDSGETEFLSTHPATPERIAETLRCAREVGGSN
jgi:predicted Zn-dependent protease